MSWSMRRTPSTSATTRTSPAPARGLPADRRASGTRAPAAPASLAAAAREVRRQAAPDVALARLEDFEELLSGSVAAERFNSILLSLFAALALALAVAGVYGV